VYIGRAQYLAWQPELLRPSVHALPPTFSLAKRVTKWQQQQGVFVPENMIFLQWHPIFQFARRHKFFIAPVNPLSPHWYKTKRRKSKGTRAREKFEAAPESWLRGSSGRKMRQCAGSWGNENEIVGWLAGEAIARKLSFLRPIGTGGVY